MFQETTKKSSLDKNPVEKLSENDTEDHKKVNQGAGLFDEFLDTKKGSFDHSEPKTKSKNKKKSSSKELLGETSDNKEEKEGILKKSLDFGNEKVERTNSGNSTSSNASIVLSVARVDHRDINVLAY